MCVVDLNYMKAGFWDELVEINAEDKPVSETDEEILEIFTDQLIAMKYLNQYGHFSREE